MPELDKTRFLKVLGMLGSSHDGEKLAALARAEAMLKAAGQGWGDVLGTSRAAPPSADARLQAALAAAQRQLAKDRAAFEAEKAAWITRMQQWQRGLSKEQEERLARQHQEDMERHRAKTGGWTGDGPPPFRERYEGPRDTYGDWGDDPDDGDPDAPDSAPRSTQWAHFAKAHPERAHWIVMNKDRRDFAASLYEWVSKKGNLTPGQAAAVDKWL